MTTSPLHIDLPAAGSALCVGIDLGTTNTVAAVGGQAIELLGTAHGAVNMPSVVAFPPSGKVLVGDAAKDRRVIDPTNTIYSSKRVLGRAWDSEAAQEFRKRYPFEMRANAANQVTFVTRGGVHSAVDIAAILLTHVRTTLPQKLANLRCAVTVPTSFTPVQRDATREAAQRANLTSVQIVDEPHAAARAYRDVLNGGLAAVYDLGGGTFNFSVLDCSASQFKVLVSDGDPYLGGDDIDFAMAAWCADQVLRRFRVDVQTDKEAYARLVEACERSKILLSREERAPIELADVDPAMLPADAVLDVDRALITSLTADLVRRTFVVCDEALRKIGVSPKRVDTVVLSGGCSHLPMIQRGLQHFFGKAPRSEFSPSQVVAIGASLSAMGD